MTPARFPVPAPGQPRRRSRQAEGGRAPPLEWLRMGRPQGGDRAHPDRSGDRYPGQEGPSRPRRPGRENRGNDSAGQPPRPASPRTGRQAGPEAMTNKARITCGAHHQSRMRCVDIAIGGRASNAGRRGQPGGVRPEAGRAAPARTLRSGTNPGRELRLGDLFGRRPVILAPVYYRCPLLCNQLLNGLDPQPEAGLARRRQGF